MTSQLQFPEPVHGAINPTAGEAAKTAGIARADRTARQLDPEWCKKCDTAIETMAACGINFQAADLVDQGLVGEPPHPNCWGGRIRAAAHRGVIEHVGWDTSHRTTGNSSGLKVWRGTAAAVEGRVA